MVLSGVFWMELMHLTRKKHAGEPKTRQNKTLGDVSLRRQQSQIKPRLLSLSKKPETLETRSSAVRLESLKVSLRTSGTCRQQSGFTMRPAMPPKSLHGWWVGCRMQKIYVLHTGEMNCLQVEATRRATPKKGTKS